MRVDAPREGRGELHLVAASEKEINRAIAAEMPAPHQNRNPVAPNEFFAGAAHHINIADRLAKLRGNRETAH